MANKTSNFAETRSLDTLVFIDGVEVPFTWIEISYAMDSPSTVRIAVAPDPLIDTWRPKSLVHVFIRDPYAKLGVTPTDVNAVYPNRFKDFDETSYILYWEGEFLAVSDVESSEQRATVLECQDFWNITEFASLAMVSVGTGLSMPMVNGSTFFPGVNDSNDSTKVSEVDLVLKALAAYLFGIKQTSTPSAVIPAQTIAAARLDDFSSGRVSMATLGKLLLEFLALYNASYGLQLVRTELSKRVTGIPDRTLQLLISQAFAQQLFSTTASKVAADTVFSLLKGMLQQYMHHTTTLPVPIPAFDKGVGIGKVVGYRELVIIPNLYYSIPPLCNWLFPDQFQMREVGRSFMEEPTRLGLRSTMTAAIGSVMQLAPSALAAKLGLSGLGDQSNVSDVFAKQGQANVVNPGTDLQKRLSDIGFYGVGANGAVDTTKNLLDFLLPTEIEKGILYVDDQNDYQELLAAAAAAAHASADEENADLDTKTRRYIDESKIPGTYPNYFRLLADYQLLFRKLSRRVTIAGPFNPWPVVGLPMMLAREGRSYRGLLTGLKSRIDYTGQSQTSYQIEYGQLFRPDPLDDVTLNHVRQAAEDIETANAAALASAAAGLVPSAQATATEQYSNLSKLSNSIADAVNRLTSSTSYKTVLGYITSPAVVKGDVPATLTYDAEMQSILLYYTFMLNVSGPARTTDAVFTETSRKQLESLLRDLAQPEADKSLIAGQIQKQFEGRNSRQFVIKYGEQMMRQFTALGFNLNDFPLPSSLGSFGLPAYISAISRGDGGAANTVFFLDWQTFLENIRKVLIATLTAQELDADRVVSTLSSTAVLDKIRPAVEVPFRSVLGTSPNTTVTLSDYASTKAQGLLSNFIGVYRAYRTRRFPPGQAFQSPSISSLLIGGTSVDSIIGDTARELLELTTLSFDETQQSLNKKLEAAVTRAQQTVEIVTAELAQRVVDVPPVFQFMNQDLTSVDGIDAGLAGDSSTGLVLPKNGAGRYSERVETESESFVKKFDAQTSLNPDTQRTTILRYDAFIRVARKIFPFADGDQGTEYQKAKIDGNVHDWANRLQARRGITLREFVTVHGLALSLPIIPTPFGSAGYYLMQSLNPQRKDVGGYFSKFGTQQTADDNLGKSIIEVRDTLLKDENNRSLLTETGRQAPIIAYSKKHVANAAFQGKK